jgi:hypothetical protein
LCLSPALADEIEADGPSGTAARDIADPLKDQLLESLTLSDSRLPQGQLRGHPQGLP